MCGMWLPGQSLLRARVTCAQSTRSQHTRARVFVRSATPCPSRARSEQLDAAARKAHEPVASRTGYDENVSGSAAMVNSDASWEGAQGAEVVQPSLVLSPCRSFFGVEHIRAPHVQPWVRTQRLRHGAARFKRASAAIDLSLRHRDALLTSRAPPACVRHPPISRHARQRLAGRVSGSIGVSAARSSLRVVPRQLLRVCRAHIRHRSACLRLLPHPSQVRARAGAAQLPGA